MSSNNLIKLNLFFQAVELEEFIKKIPNVSSKPIERSFDYVYSIPLYNSCDNSKVGIFKPVGNALTYNNLDGVILAESQTYTLPNGSLTFDADLTLSLKRDPTTGTIFFPADIPIPLSFSYGTGDYYKANVKYASLIPLADSKKTRIIEIIIQK